MHSRTTLDAASLIWQFLKLVHVPRPVDFILCLGSHDVRVAVRGAELWQAGFAPRLVISGGLAHQGDVLDTGWNRPEADVLAEVAQASGVPRDAIMLERSALNTGENFALTRQLLTQLPSGRPPASCLVVAKLSMTRRGFVAGRKVWPELELWMQCEAIEFDTYLAREEKVERTITSMAGDLHRILVYPHLGFQIAQTVPSPVMQALETLVAAGFTDRMVPGYSIRGEKI
ncbi:MAG: YdcF family protein [Reyranella sp.]|nr:YdcF family protein [Reyranella sp.]